MTALNARCIALLAGFAVAAGAQPDDLLARAKRAMRQRLETTPNHACVLEIDRLVYDAGVRSRYRSKDLSRLEVAVADGRELFGWPGEASTQPTLNALLGPGLSSTGEFSVHGRAAFLEERSRIERLPEASQDATEGVGYQYRVPLEASRYVVAAKGGGVVAPYEGEFWVDAQSAELLQFDIRVPRPPPRSRLASIRSTVRYGVQDVNGVATWLPAEARIEVEAASGEGLTNLLRFQRCRAFQTESTIRFTAADADQTAAAAKPVAGVPAGVGLRTELISQLDSVDARAGDEIEMRLLQQANGPDGIILPEDAEIRARLRRLKIVDTTPSAAGKGRVDRIAALTLEVLEVRWADECAPLAATLERVESIPQMGRLDPGSVIPTRSALRARTYETAHQMSQKGSGSFVIHGDMFLVRRGARMRWKTEEPPDRPCAQ